MTDGVESAVAQARAAAGHKSVEEVGGVDVTQQLLAAGLADELHLDVMPVLLGTGVRFFGGGVEGLGLEKIGVQRRMSSSRRSGRTACCSPPETYSPPGTGLRRALAGARGDRVG